MILSAAASRGAKRAEPPLPHNRITLSTSLGDIVIALDHARAPRTAGHFLRLVQEQHLADASFYRAVHKSNTPGHLPTIDVLQGGRGFAASPDAPSVAHEPTSETGLRHVTGAVSMARGKDADASTEFFICLGDFPVLDAGGVEGPGASGFAAFAMVERGLDVVRRIHALPAEAPAPAGWEFLQGQFLSDPLTLHARLS